MSRARVDAQQQIRQPGHPDQSVSIGAAAAVTGATGRHSQSPAALRPPKSVPGRSPLTRRTRWLAACVAFTVLSTALVTALFAAGLAQAAGPPRLLLLPVVVHSAEDPEYLREGLSDMLAARFERIGALDLVRAAPGARGTTEIERALTLARKAGADYVLFGSFTRFGQGASLDVQCVPVPDPGTAESQREPLREIFVHSGSIGEIIPDLDELAGKVSRFARGEVVSPGAPSAPGRPGGSAAPGASAGAIRDLTERVRALESALTELLERDQNAGTAGTSDELR